MSNLVFITLSVAITGIGFLAYQRITSVRRQRMSDTEKGQVVRRTVVSATVLELGLVLVLASTM